MTTHTGDYLGDYVRNHTDMINWGQHILGTTSGTTTALHKAYWLPCWYWTSSQKWEKKVSRMWENLYLCIKNPKASMILKQVLDPGHKWLALLMWLYSAMSATFSLRSSLAISWIHTCTLQNISVRIILQWKIQDFPEVGVPTLQGMPTYNFAKISQKLHKIERIWLPGERLSCSP